MKFQVASDIHLENFKPGQTIRSVIKPVAENLIIAGDLGRVENANFFKNALKDLCSVFKRVIFVPGNHEYYSMGLNKINMANVDLFLHNLSLEEGFRNLTILNNNTTVVDDVLIFGSTFWSQCPQQHYLATQLYKNGKLVDATEYNNMHKIAVQTLRDTIDYASREHLRLLVVTHHAPSFEGTLAPHHIVDNKAPAKGNTKNYMYCSDNIKLVNDPVVVAWIYGHTGYNGNIGKLVTNQMDKPTGIRNAVLTIKPFNRVPQPLPSPVALTNVEQCETYEMMELEN
jgi:predicted phosphodiesterase